MGQPIPNGFGASGKPAAGDQANGVVSGSFTVAGQVSTPFAFWGAFNVAIWGTFVATLQVEKSYDGGTTWIPLFNFFTGAAVAFTAPGSLQIGECERGVTYRMHCTQYVSGTANYRFSTNGLMAMSSGVSAV